MTALLVFLGAAVGAPLRYLTDRAVQARHDSVFPWGTLTVNVVGCLLFGALMGAGPVLPAAAAALVGTGCLGALTTWSTFSYETLRLTEDGAWLYAAANILVSVTLGFGAAVLGHAVAAALV